MIYSVELITTAHYINLTTYESSLKRLHFCRVVPNCNPTDLFCNVQDTILLTLP
jgi:hypothetical protein